MNRAITRRARRTASADTAALRWIGIAFSAVTLTVALLAVISVMGS